MKYELIKDDEGYNRIRSIINIDSIGVKIGDVGGIVDSEKNLSQLGNCWIFYGGRATAQSYVYGDALVFGNARLFGNAQVYGNARVFGYAKVYGDARVFGNTQVYGNARVYGTAIVHHNVSISKDALITKEDDFICFSNVGSENGVLTCYKNIHGGITVTRGCFNETIDEFKKAVNEKHGNNIHGQMYSLFIQAAKMKLV